MTFDEWIGDRIPESERWRYPNIDASIYFAQEAWSAALSSRSPEGEWVSVETEELYYVQDMRSYCGNSVFWWCPEGNGYTTDLRKAWRVSKEKALRMMRHRPDVDRAWLCADIDAGVQTHFDMQNLRNLKPLSPPSTSSPEETKR